MSLHQLINKMVILLILTDLGPLEKICFRPSHLLIICYHLMDHECEGRVT